MQNRHRTVHPANAGEFGAHRQTRAESSCLCSMVAVLIVCEYICKHLSAVWVCELRRWRIKLEGMRIHCEGKCISVRQADSKDQNGITDINHIIILHLLSSRSTLNGPWCTSLEKKFSFVRRNSDDCYVSFVWTLTKKKKIEEPFGIFYPSLKGHARAIRGRDELATTVLTAPSMSGFVRIVVCTLFYILRQPV